MVTTPPQPASKARMMLLSDSVGRRRREQERVLEPDAREHRGQVGHWVILLALWTRPPREGACSGRSAEEGPVVTPGTDAVGIG